MKYFFDQDDDCHWYMIPAEKRKEWEALQKVDVETDEGYAAWQEFSEYMTGGGINNIEFENPTKTK